MNNKTLATIIVTVVAAMAPPAFAQGHFSAFDGVPGEEVSEAELNQISAEGGFTLSSLKSVRPVWMAAQIGLQAYDIGQAVGFAASCVTMPGQCTSENLPSWKAPINRVVGSALRR